LDTRIHENLLTLLSNLHPGGWAEFADLDIRYYSQDDSVNDDNALRRWRAAAENAVQKTGRTLVPGKHLEQWLKDAGFVNVQVVKSPLPLGIWPKDPKMVFSLRARLPM